MEKPSFLDKKFTDLTGSKPVERAVQKKKRLGEKAPNQRAERIGAYIDRLEDIFKNPMGHEKTKGDRGGFELLKHKILKKYTTKQDEIPESYWKLQEKIMRERGQAGDWENASEAEKREVKRQNSEGVLADQRSSLEQWVDYFGSSDSNAIPKELKYWIFRNVVGLQEYDKDKKEFPKRSKGTIKQFPDINYEALAYVVDAVIKKLGGKALEFEHDIQANERQEFLRFLEKEDFAKLYAWANELMNPIPEHLLPITDGEWRKYNQNSDAVELVQTIRGKGTGWCTAGENTARTQLGAGDFYVFYSLDDDQKPTIPRIAIRMEGSKIAEVRGVAYKQNLDPYMGEVLAAKLEEFPDKAQYLKKESDMKRLTEVERKTKLKEALTRDELVFFYEINTPIEGFGYQRDPRLNEIQALRDMEQDMLIVLECTEGEIAHNEDEINRNTKAYVGKLTPGIFQKLPDNLEHIYSSFPHGKILRENLGVGGKDTKQLIKEMKAANINTGGYAKSMLENPDFVTGKNREEITLIRLTVADLGFAQGANTSQIFARAQELGLELCPPDTGPNYRLKYQNQPLGEWIYVGMEPITASFGLPSLFKLFHNAVGLWLSSTWAKPDHVWLPDYEFVFRLRKVGT